MPEMLVTGKDAAAVFGATRSEEVWRAVKRHGEDYPGRIEAIEVGRGFAARRDELAAFSAWYRENVHRATRPNVKRSSPAGEQRAAAGARKQTAVARAAVSSERRAALREAIARVIERQETDEIW